MSFEDPDRQETVISLLQDVDTSADDDVVEPMLKCVRGTIPPSALDFKDWTEPLKFDHRLWLVIANDDTHLIHWIHFDSERGHFCTHPVNDWNGYVVDVDELKRIMNGDDGESKINIEPRHKQHTPLEESH